MDKLRSIMYLLVITLLLTGCISIPTGDGGKMKLSKDGVEIEGKDGEKSSIDLDTDEGGLSITTGDEGEESGVTVNMGSHAEVPDEFPQDISLPTNEFLVMSGTSPKDKDDGYSRNSITLSYQIEDDDFVESVEMYDKYLVENGFEVERIEIGPTMHTLMGTKGENSLTISVIADEESYLLQFMYFYE
ncbi:hypothetical protein JSQ81_04495 [Sporosarcina sp. Marseille-Q4063]|uniref:hypothetical protein n=1 Tax=Sporosarcina sp. Marseille-Q4063 TaxID=2810514 RepID=UPI001BAF7378|nr:hypothetical protein [Sporosarcina sp. Marseille-Q4063]QUW22846.1 hypothetical protein JSQ81_04495 [Sporosarcina sp. Marseille-Q4063]